MMMPAKQILMVIVALSILSSSIVYAQVTTVPSMVPSLAPSITTNIPSNSPSLPLTGEENIMDCTMTFEYLKKLMPNGQTVQDWEEITTDHVAGYISSIKKVTYLLLNVSFTDQDYLNEDNNNANLRLRTRRLDGITDDTNPPDRLLITFNVNVKFRSDDPEYNIYEAVGDAFITWNSRKTYINKLIARNEEVFGTIDNIEVFVPEKPVPVVPTPAPVSEESSSGGLSMTMLIVIVAAAAGLLLFVIVVFFYTKVRKDGMSKTQRRSKPANTDSGQRVQVSTYIETRPIVDGDISTLGYPTVTKPPGFTGNVVTKEEDVSTLGDPTIFGGKSIVNHKSPKRVGPSSEIPKTDGSFDGISTASDSIIPGNMNTYSRIYGSNATVGTNPTLATATMRKFTSGKSGKDLFEFQAPAGSLGIMIDMTAECGPHTVHAIKADSILSDLLRIGDKIVSFDDEDVGAMTAMELTQLIGSRGNNPSRKFVILRPR